MNDVIIFGAGDYGNIAFYCFRDRCNIVGYVDNDSKRWGNKLNGLPILKPDVLKEKRYSIMIANRDHLSSIKEQLSKEYGVKEAIVFSYDLSCVLLDDNDELSSSLDDELIVHFRGSLGNQMFIYAAYKNFQKRGGNVTADLSYYVNLKKNEASEEMSFTLQDVFPNINIKQCHSSKKDIMLSMRLCTNVMKLPTWRSMMLLSLV